HLEHLLLELEPEPLAQPSHARLRIGGELLEAQDDHPCAPEPPFSVALGADDAAPEQAREQRMVGAARALALGGEAGGVLLVEPVAGGAAMPVAIRRDDRARIAEEAHDAGVGKDVEHVGDPVHVAWRLLAPGGLAVQLGAPPAERLEVRVAAAAQTLGERAQLVRADPPLLRVASASVGAMRLREEVPLALVAHGAREGDARPVAEPRPQVVEVMRLRRDPQRAVRVQDRADEVRPRPRGPDDEDGLHGRTASGVLVDARKPGVAARTRRYVPLGTSLNDGAAAPVAPAARSTQREPRRAWSTSRRPCTAAAGAAFAASPTTVRRSVTAARTRTRIAGLAAERETAL